MGAPSGGSTAGTPKASVALGVSSGAEVSGGGRGAEYSRGYDQKSHACRGGTVERGLEPDASVRKGTITVGYCERFYSPGIAFSARRVAPERKGGRDECG